MYTIITVIKSILQSREGFTVKIKEVSYNGIIEDEKEVKAVYTVLYTCQNQSKVSTVQVYLSSK